MRIRGGQHGMLNVYYQRLMHAVLKARLCPLLFLRVLTQASKVIREAVSRKIVFLFFKKERCSQLNHTQVLQYLLHLSLLNF